jgi:hypothetical protein
MDDAILVDSRVCETPVSKHMYPFSPKQTTYAACRSVFQPATYPTLQRVVDALDRLLAAKLEPGERGVLIGDGTKSQPTMLKHAARIA